MIFSGAEERSESRPNVGDYICKMFRLLTTLSVSFFFRTGECQWEYMVNVGSIPTPDGNIRDLSLLLSPVIVGPRCECGRNYMKLRVPGSNPGCVVGRKAPTTSSTGGASDSFSHWLSSRGRWANTESYRRKTEREKCRKPGTT